MAPLGIFERGKLRRWPGHFNLVMELAGYDEKRVLFDLVDQAVFLSDPA